MAMRAQTFAGTPTTGVLWNPFIAPAPLLSGFGGVPLGPDLKTRRLVVMDPWQSQQNREIHSTVLNIFGEKDYGKTTLMRTLAYRLMRLQAGIRQGHPVDMRGRIHSRKPEGDSEGKEVSEYQALSNNLRSRMFSPAAFGSVNIFDPKMNMSYSDLLETATNAIELVTEQHLTGLQPLVLQVGVWKMQRDYKQFAAPELLEGVIRTLSIQDKEAFFDATNQNMLVGFADALRENPDLEVQLKATLQNPDNVDNLEFTRAAGRVSAHLGEITHGTLGTLFRGTGSLYDIMSEEMVTFDWDRIGGKARSLLASMLWKWQTLNPELRPHVNLQEEAGTYLDSLMEARFQYNYVKKARAYETCDISGTQYRFDISRKGEAGSELRSLGEGILVGTGMQLFTRQPENTDVLHDLTTLGISDMDVQFMTTLEVGSFGIKVPGRPISFFQLALTPIDWKFNQGNAASSRMTTRSNVWTNEDFVRRAQEVGITRIGEET